jgi:hypothetical protein
MLSARQQATVASHERAEHDRDRRNETVTPHALEEGDWVLVRHERPQKFECKWFGPYQVVQKMMLGTYRLQDPNGKELHALVHGNRLLKANLRTTEELRHLWASPAAKDVLRRYNSQTELVPADDEGTAALERYLFETEYSDNDDSVPTFKAAPAPIATASTSVQVPRKRQHAQMTPEEPKERKRPRRTATVSPT